MWYCQFDVSPVNYSDSDLHTDERCYQQDKTVVLIASVICIGYWQYAELKFSETQAWIILKNWDRTYLTDAGPLILFSKENLLISYAEMSDNCVKVHIYCDSQGLML